MNRRDAIKALMTGLPATAALSVARLEPDDVIVVECDHEIEVEAAAQIRETLTQVWPGRKVVVCRGVRIKIVKDYHE